MEIRQITIKNSRDLNIVADLYSPESESIVIMVQGFSCDRFFQGRTLYYAKALSEAGLALIVFDFPGIGESDDEIINFTKHVEDLKFIINYVIGLGYKHISLLGVSLGALTCLHSFNSNIGAIVCLGGLTGPMQYNLNILPEEEKALQTKGFVEKSAHFNMNRKIIKVDYSMIQEIASVNQEGILSLVKCPVLMIHGNEDDTERHFYGLSLKALQFLPENSRVQMIEGATHGFWGYIDQTRKIIVDYFLENFRK